MRAGRPQIVRFETFELDLKAGELRRQGVAVALPPQQFTVLAALIEDAGALVTREQLRARLWGDDSFVDFDAGLNFCIRQLRLALGDTATQPRFIQTVPRRGYRFVAPINVAAPAAAMDEPSPAGQVSPRARSVVPALLAALAVVGAAVAWWLMTSASTSDRLSAEHRIADAHSAHGFVALNDDWAWPVAERSFGRALQADPTHEVALISMSRLRASQGRFAEAVEYARRAVDAHPESLRAQATLGWSHLFAGDYQSALTLCSQASARHPKSSYVHHCRLHAESELGSDHREAWQQLLKEATDAHLPTSSFQRAVLTARLGEYSAALVHIRQALDSREPDAMFATVHPAFVGLRTHPDFIAALNSAGLREISSPAH